MKNFTQKRRDFFKYAFLLLLFFSISPVRAQNCAGLKSIYQTKGVTDGSNGHVDIYKYDLPSQSFINIQTLNIGLSNGSGAASAFNSSTGLLYIHGDSSHSGRDIRVYDPSNNFAYVGVIDLSGSNGVSIYANMFSVGDYIYIRDENGDNLARFNAVNVVFSGQVASATLNSYVVSGPSRRCNDYTYHEEAGVGTYYGIVDATATSCTLVLIDQATNVLTTRTLNITNPSASHNFSGDDFGAVWVDKKGTLFAFNNATGNVYLVKNVGNPLSTGISWVLPSGTSSSNDGFACDALDLFTPILNITPPTCSTAGTATITNYLDNPNINYIFYDSGGTVVNYVSVGPGGVITGLHYGETYTAALHIIDIDFTSSPSDPFVIFDILTPVTAGVTPSSATTNCSAPSVALLATGGVSYSWSPVAGLSDPNIPNPIATPTTTTVYTVTVTGANGCTATATATITVNNTPITPTISSTPPNCLAAGTSTISNYSAANTYTFTPAGPTVNGAGLISGMVIGTSYTVTVAANVICPAVTSAPFSNAAILVTPAIPTISSTPPTCLATGTSTISNYSASNTYTFTPTGPTAGAGGLISGMVIGTSYTVTASNASCTSGASASFSNAAILITPAIPTISSTPPTCLATGTSTISNYNAANTYTFTPAGPTAGAGGLISGMVIGTSYTVTTSNGSCTSGSSASFSNAAILVTPAVPTISSTAPTCLVTGTSTISNYSASNTYTFTPTGPTAGAGGLISGMVIGTSYTVTANNGSCTSGASAPFSNAAILITPAVPTISSTPPTCLVAGTSTISNYNAANTYTFTPTGPTAGAGGLISGMVIGTSYTVTASNASCTSGASASFSNAAILVTPAVPTISSTAPTCLVAGTSTISNYSASNTYTFTPTGPTAGAGGLISGMVIGTSYTVTANNGSCTSGASASFSNAAILVTPAVPTISSTPPTCLAAGTSTISNYSAANTYTFTPAGPTVNGAGLISGMVIGTSYTVTASNGSCTSGSSASFSNAAILITPAVPTISSTPPTCLATGTSTISNYNPANTYTFTPTGPTTGAGGLISGMVIGTSYTVTATNASCTSGASASFSNAAILVTPAVPTISSTPPTCLVAGTSTISNYNAANTYIFTPTGPTAGAGGLISGMVIGTSYTVTASNGSCTSGASASFSNAAILVTPAVPTISSTAPTCLVAGTSTISNYNASNTYTFTPTGPTAGAGGLISGMVIGTSYTVTASNASCTSGASASFSNAAVLVTPAVPTISTTAPTCSVAGTSTISNYNAANTYIFTPTGPTVDATGLISGMVIGTSYTVTASNANCTSGASLPFSNAAVLVTPAVPTITSTPPTCLATGTSTISNYNAANTYIFTPTGPTVDGTGLISGMTVGTSYTVTASSGSCTSGVSLPFSNASVLVTPAVPTISTTAPTCSVAGTSTISNYNAANTYIFTPTGPTVDATGLISGMTIGTSYTVTASNASCTSGASLPFSNAAVLVTPSVPTITSTPPTCLATGTSTISNYSATNTYIFTPTGPTVDGTGLISGMTVGTSYTVTATSGICTSGASLPFSNAAILVTPAVPTISTTAPTCSVAGTSTISNYNAANTYTFTPTGPTVDATGLISGMVIGTSYTVTASNASCTSGASLPFNNAAVLVTPAVPTITSTPPTCLATGTSTISNYNAANTYIFTPTGPTVDGTGLISGMTVGTSYTVTATSGICTSGASLPFSNAAILVTPAVPTISTTAPTCSVAGTSTISNYNAANTYTFTPTGPTVDATGLISGMVIGTSYTVTASNANCTSGASLPFSNAAVLVTPAVPTISSTPPTCLATGTSTISNYNAANTYIFTPTGPTVDGTGLISGMTVGTSYTVTASNGSCTSGASASFSNAAILVTPAVPTISTTAPTCSVAGTSTISNYNASNTYTFTPTGPTVDATGLISGMVIGTSYTVTASNASCTSGASLPFSNAAVLVTPAVPTISSTPPTCLATGTSTISNYNAANTYLFTPTGPTVDGTGLISGMTVGTSYTVTATSGICTSGASASFSNAAILITPAVPTITSTPPTCSVAGTSTISNYSAANTYTFTPTGPTVDATGLISGMTVGTSYTVTASNASCTSGASLPFSNAAVLVTPAVPTITSTPPTCLATGTSTISNYSATNTYTFTPTGPTVGAGGLISGMVIGTSYIVTTSNGSCTSGASAPFSNAAVLVTPIIPTISSTPPTCFVTGTSTISNYNAANTYTFIPTGPTVDATGLISGMVIGTSYTVTTSNGACSSGASVPFNNATVLVTPAVPTINSTPPTCSVAGISTISNYSAANTYTFTPAGPTVNGTGLISGMVIGTSYTVTTSNGSCTSGASAPFSNATVLITPTVPTISSTSPTCLVAGTSTISNYNAGNTYTFTPAGPIVDATGLISGMIAGTLYTVATSNGACTSGASVPFSNAAILVTPAVPTISSTPPTCSVAGISTISNYSAANTYTFTPTGPTVGAGGLISGMVIGTSYTVTSSNGTCTSGASASFSNAAILVTPAAPITATPTQPDCPSTTGSVVLSDLPSGNWTINPGGITGNTPTTTVTGLNPGTYHFTVTNDSGCTSLPSADVVIINVICPECQELNPIKVFNAVSPGITDGLNDFFYVQALDDFDCYPTNTVQIYNRWGVLVFERDQYSNDSNRGFVGMSEGRVTVSKNEKLPEGTYYYIINYTGKKGDAFNITGFLQLKWN